MNLKHLPNQTLHDETLAAAANEKSATLTLLDFLAEVDLRRLYNARGYSSLWEYVHLALGYSEASASERVSAMRLMQKIPEVKTELAENRLTLTAASKLGSFVRREKCSPEKTNELLQMVTAKPTREVERVLASHQTVPVTKPDVMRASGPETTRVAFDADPEFMALYEELRDLQGRPQWGMSDRLKDAMRELIERKKKVSSAATTAVRAPEGKKSSRYIPVRTKRETIERSGRQCEFVDPVSKRRCSSRFGLQFDHIRPFARGGSARPDNIRQLCANHNRFEAIREFGIRSIPCAGVRKSGSRGIPLNRPRPTGD
jgi:hypothetical protein